MSEKKEHPVVKALERFIKQDNENSFRTISFQEWCYLRKLMREALPLARELIAACEERDEKDKELSRLRFRVKRGVWPPAGLPESEWEKHAQEWPHAESADLEDARTLIRSFDAAIRKIAYELTGQACGGVDTGDEINPETDEPYGPGGHTGWLLATEARKLREEWDNARNDCDGLMLTVQELRTAIVKYVAASEALDWVVSNYSCWRGGNLDIQRDMPEHLRKRLEGKT